MGTRQPTKKTVKTAWHRFIGSAACRWLQKVTVLTIFSLVVNHLTTPESFPGNELYKFPIEGFLSTILLYFLIEIIAYLNFKSYKKKHFSKKVEIITITWFMVSTLGYITIVYIPVNIILNIIAGGETELYYLLIDCCIR